MAEQQQQEVVALYIRPADGTQAPDQPETLQWMKQLTRAPAESNQAFMAKVVAGLQ